MKYEASQCFDVRSDLVVEEIDAQALILDMGRNVYFSLNAVGVVMFAGLQSGQTLAQICDEVVVHFDAPRDVVFEDAQAFVASLFERGLVSLRV